MGTQRQAGRQNAETISIPGDKKEAARKSECVLKMLSQKPNVVAFVMGRAFTRSFRL